MHGKFICVLSDYFVTFFINQKLIIMKKITLLFLLTVFAFGLTKAQVTKNTETWTSYECWEIPCISDFACGELTFTETWWHNPDGSIKKHQWLIKGEMERDGGDVYTLSQVTNDQGWTIWLGIDKKGAESDTYIKTITWEKDGIPVGVTHITYHQTLNANGEMTIDINKIVSECY